MSEEFRMYGYVGSITLYLEGISDMLQLDMASFGPKYIPEATYFID